MSNAAAGRGCAASSSPRRLMTRFRDIGCPHTASRGRGAAPGRTRCPGPGCAGAGGADTVSVTALTAEQTPCPWLLCHPNRHCVCHPNRHPNRHCIRHHPVTRTDTVSVAAPAAQPGAARDWGTGRCVARARPAAIGQPCAHRDVGPSKGQTAPSAGRASQPLPGEADTGGAGKGHRDPRVLSILRSPSSQNAEAKPLGRDGQSREGCAATAPRPAPPPQTFLGKQPRALFPGWICQKHPEGTGTPVPLDLHNT